MGILDSSRDMAQVENNTYDGSCGKAENLHPFLGADSLLRLVVTKRLLTIDVEAVLVQGEGAQLGDAMGLMAQLPVQLLSV